MATASETSPPPMTIDALAGRFRSILYMDGAEPAGAAPACLRDLNLDQAIAAMTAGKDEYDLAPYFHAPLTSEATIGYRQAVLRDLEDRRVRDCLSVFGQDMRETRDRLQQSTQIHNRLQKQIWFLHAVEAYCAALVALDAKLAALSPGSEGLRAFGAWLDAHLRAAPFTTLRTAAAEVTAGLAGIRYAIAIRGSGFRVQPCEDEADYSVQVAEVFEKFRQGAATDYRVKFHEYAEMNHIEAKVLEFVAQLNPEVFAALAAFRAAHAGFIDPVLARFDRELQFYQSYLDYIARTRRAGLRFCYPTVSATSKEVAGDAIFDLPLAHKLVGDEVPVVCNDFRLERDERIFLVSGPNQGGKTTFARTFGQLHYLASLGLMVPGRQARLFLPDAIFTHFEKAEVAGSRQGKLQEELTRIHAILRQATPRSIIILNEIFNSTALEDAMFLARKVLGEIVTRDAFCVSVTFLDELASLSPGIVSMVSTIVPDNPAERTYKLIRRPADGRSYAISIAEKYRLTQEALLARLPT